MSNIDSILTKFLEAQKERLKERTYLDCDSVIDINYSYQYLDEQEMAEWKRQYTIDEECYTKLFGIDKISSSTYRDFFEYFLIRKVASGESFMKTAVRVMKKFKNWMLKNDYIDRSQHSDLIDYFGGKKQRHFRMRKKLLTLFMR